MTTTLQTQQANLLEQIKLLNRDQAADYMGVRNQTLAAWACRQEGPNFIKCGKSVRYRLADLDAWLESQTVRFED